MATLCVIPKCKGLQYSASMRLCYEHTFQAWDKGVLARKLHVVQQRMRMEFYKATASAFDEVVWNCARRLGKTFLLVLLAFEFCRKKPRSRVAFGASYASDVEDIIEPMVDEILEDCPEKLLPKLRWSKFKIQFPDNGSQIKIAGCDKGNYRHLRGRALDLWIVDEAGFVTELEKIVDDVLSPQTWTTGGKGIIASTPPETVGHHFQQRYLIAKQNGASQRFTIDDNPMITPERREEIIKKHARKKGMTMEEFIASTVYQREYRAEFVTDTERAVLPEYTEARELATLKKRDSRPLWVDRYVSMDVGPTRDWTAILYAYFDFDRQKLVIQKERRMIRPATLNIAEQIKEDEGECFGKVHMPGTEIFRYGDATDILWRDLANDHRLLFGQTQKDDRDASIMAVRDWLIQGKIEIDPSCTHLTAQMRAAIWNKNHTEFERLEGFGHFDFVAALIYLVRNVLPNVNRLPRHYGLNRDTHFINPIFDTSTDGDSAFQNFFSPG